MTTTRTPLHRRQLPHVTPQTLAWFQRCEEVLADGSGESDGENREEFLDLSARLRLALGLTPADRGPLGDDVDGPDPPSWMKGNARRCANWRRGWAIREMFLQAAEAEARRARPRPRSPSATPCED